jgi:tungstate transport system substrate-binding protein
MYNYFLIVGPENDPAKIKNNRALDAFQKIYNKKAKFVSRSDNSGTHKKELSIWRKLKINPKGDWYIQSGTGMQTTLRIANEKNAYCLVDRATYLSHKKEIDLQILVEGDSILYNPYSVIVLSPKKFPWINYKLAKKFVDFIRSPEGQKIIENFGVKEFGKPLFFLEKIK